MTYTYALVPVPPTVYAAIRALLVAAGHEQAIHDHGEDEVIDMHGIALSSKPGQSVGHDLTVSSLVSSRTGKGRVEIQVNAEVMQLDLDKARELREMLSSAIEAAISDQILSEFLTSKGASKELIASALLDFRERRQGSRDRVIAN